MSEPIKILHVLTRMNRGGAEIRTIDVMRHADRTRFEFHICVLTGEPGTLDAEVLALGGHIHPMGVRLFRFGRDFRRLILRHGFHVVHSHVHLSSGLILRHAALAGIPGRIAHFRSSHDGRAAGPLRGCQRALMRRWIRRYATQIVAVSDGAMAGALRARWTDDPRCRVIYNGIHAPSFIAPTAEGRSLRREFGVLDDAPLYVHVGRLTKAKNHPRLLAIFAHLALRQPQAKLLLVGRAEESIERNLRRTVADLGLSDRVVFCGERADVARFLTAADAMIFPSLWEGLPGAVLEACAAGLPVVASDLPSMQEVAERLPDVRLVPLSAPDEEWAQTIGALPRGAAAEEARRRAQRRFADSVFAIQRCVDEMCGLWEEARRRRAA